MVQSIKNLGIAFVTDSATTTMKITGEVKILLRRVFAIYFGLYPVAVGKVVSVVSKEVKKKRKHDTRKQFDSFDENVIERTVHRLHKEKKFVSFEGQYPGTSMQGHINDDRFS